MTSIPADPTLALGNIIRFEQVQNLMEIAELQKPVDLASERLNNLIGSSYKLKMIFDQMVNLKVELSVIKKLTKEIQALKKSTGEAAVDLAEATIQAGRDIREKKLKMSQTKIGKSIESPIDWAISSLAPQNISYDSLRFDVKYFSELESKDKSSAGTSQSNETSTEKASKYVKEFFFLPGENRQTANSHAKNSFKTRNEQVQSSAILGTVVIAASCVHKTADIFAPCILDAKKSIGAWNHIHPDDKLGTDPTSIMEAALSGDEANLTKKIHLLTGVSRGSSFVGFCNILKTDDSKSTSETEAVATAVADSIKRNMWYKNQQGTSSMNQQESSAASSMFATAKFETSCNLSVQGLIPSIVAKEYISVIKGLNPDPTTITNQMKAVADASSKGINDSNSINAAAGDAKKGGQFMALNNDHLEGSVNAVVDADSVKNKVIDITSMMTAFSDYVKRASAGEEGVGIPINYFVKELDKADIAKVYARKYYPNGASGFRQAMDGQLGKDGEETGA